MVPQINSTWSVTTFIAGLTLFILSTMRSDCQPRNAEDSAIHKDTTHQVQLPLPMGSEVRLSPTQDQWEIQWDGTPEADFYVTYGFITEIDGVESEKSASFSGNDLPWRLSFFLEPDITVTATLNLSATGSVSITLLRNGQPCDTAEQIGEQPSLRVTCFPN